MDDNKQLQSNKKSKPSTIAIIIEIIMGLLGIYGIGHLLSKRWISGISFLGFSFIWLIIEGLTKDVILRGNYPTGLCALTFHLPILLISIVILKKD